TASTLPLYFLSFHAPPPTENYTLSLHDALPILNIDVRGQTAFKAIHDPIIHHIIHPAMAAGLARHLTGRIPERVRWRARPAAMRSEEHTSELQSPYDLVCRLLLEKKNKQTH